MSARERVSWWRTSWPPCPDRDAARPAAPPPPERPPASLIQSARQRRADASRDRLLAAIRLINRTDEEAWRAADARLAREREMGLHPRRGYVTASALVHRPGAVMDRARRGEHVTVTDAGERAAVIVDADEYAALVAARERMEWQRLADIAAGSGEGARDG